MARIHKLRMIDHPPGCVGSSSLIRILYEPTSSQSTISVAVLAKYCSGHPEFIFYYQKIYLQDQSIQKNNNLILKKTSLSTTAVWQYSSPCSEDVTTTQASVTAVKPNEAAVFT